jgi:hypothetical protein
MFKFQGLGVKNIKKQYRVSEEINTLLKKGANYVNMSENDYINQLIVNASEKFKVLQETEEVLKNGCNEVILYTDTKSLGQSNSINCYQYSKFRIEKSKNPNFYYWVEILNTIVDYNGNIIFEAGHSYFFNDLKEFFSSTENELKIDRRSFANTNSFLAK